MNLQLAYLDKLDEGKEIGKEIGEKIGKEIGEKIGRENTQKENAKRMIAAKKIPLEDISFYTGLSLTEVETLKKELSAQ